MIKKILKLILYTLVILEVIYFLGVAAILNIPFLFSKVVPLNPKELIIGIAKSWSWFPGHFHLTEIKILGQDKNVKWKIQLRHSKAKISLPDLFNKQLKFKLFQADEVKFEIDQKNEKERKTWKDEPDTLSLKEKKQQHWRLKFDHILLSHAPYLRMDNFVYRGEAAIQGTFFLWPAIEAEIGPATLSLQGGEVIALDHPQDSKPIMTQVFGHFLTKISKFDINKTQGSEVLNFLNLSGDLKSGISSIRALNYSIKTPNLHFNGEKTDLTAKIQIQNGKIQEGSSFYVKPTAVQILIPAFQLDGSGKISGEVRKTTSSLDLFHLAVELQDYKAHSKKHQFTLIEGEQLSLHATSKDLKLIELFEEVFISLDVPHGKISSHSKALELNKTSPNKISIRNGKGKLNAKISCRLGKITTHRNRVPEGFVNFSLPSLEFNWKAAHMKGNLSGSFNINEIDLNALVVKVPRGGFSLYNVNWNILGEKQDTEDKNWSLSGELLPHSSKESQRSISGALRLKMKHTIPLLKLYQQTQSLPWIQKLVLKFPDPSIFTEFSILEDRILLKRLKLDSKFLLANGNLSFTPSGTWGNVKMKYGIFSAGVQFRGKESDFKLFP